MAGIAGNDVMLMWGANFACADLSEADFSGRPIFVFIYNDPVIGGAGHYNFARANLWHTKLVGFKFLFAVPMELLKGSKNPGLFEIQKLFPALISQAAGPSQPIKAAGGKDYFVWDVTTNAEFQFTGRIDTRAFWDMVLAFRQLHTARNLLDADMPLGMKTFIQTNEKIFSPVLGDPGCTPVGQ